MKVLAQLVILLIWAVCISAKSIPPQGYLLPSTAPRYEEFSSHTPHAPLIKFTDTHNFLQIFEADRESSSDQFKSLLTNDNLEIQNSQTKIDNISEFRLGDFGVRDLSYEFPEFIPHLIAAKEDTPFKLTSDNNRKFGSDDISPFTFIGVSNLDSSISEAKSSDKLVAPTSTAIKTTSGKKGFFKIKDGDSYEDFGVDVEPFEKGNEFLNPEFNDKIDHPFFDKERKPEVFENDCSVVTETHVKTNLHTNTHYIPSTKFTTIFDVHTIPVSVFETVIDVKTAILRDYFTDLIKSKIFSTTTESITSTTYKFVDVPISSDIKFETITTTLTSTIPAIVKSYIQVTEVYRSVTTERVSSTIFVTITESTTKTLDPTVSYMTKLTKNIVTETATVPPIYSIVTETFYTKVPLIREISAAQSTTTVMKYVKTASTFTKTDYIGTTVTVQKPFLYTLTEIESVVFHPTVTRTRTQTVEEIEESTIAFTLPMKFRETAVETSVSFVEDLHFSTLVTTETQFTNVLVTVTDVKSSVDYLTVSSTFISTTTVTSTQDPILFYHTVSRTSPCSTVTQYTEARPGYNYDVPFGGFHLPLF